MFWVFVPSEQVGPEAVEFTGSKAHHLARVLRIRPGERGVAVSDGREYHVEVTAVQPNHVRGRILEARANTSEPAVTLTLLQALLPNPDFDAVVEGVTATGVCRILPVEAERSVVRPSAGRVERWRAIAESAAEQSRRGRVPDVMQPAPLADAVLRVGSARILVLHPGTPTRLRAAAAGERAIALAVGPEGGWTPDEVRTLVDAGASTATLGPRILRARLAPVIATAILIDQA